MRPILIPYPSVLTISLHTSLTSPCQDLQLFAEGLALATELYVSPEWKAGGDGREPLARVSV